MSKFCCTCIYWEKVIPQIGGDDFGVCHDETVAFKVALDGKTKLGQDGMLSTQGYFGCIFWRQNDGSVVNFKRIIDSDTGKLL